MSSPVPQQPDRRALDKEIFALAVPTFATLVSEPMLLIVDSAVIGHVSTTSLAGLGVAMSVFSVVVGLSIFLAYGTTATVARRLGAGDRAGALAGGLDGITLGVGIGVLAALTVGLAAEPLVGLYRPDPAVAAEAVAYLQVVAVALPSVLVVLAATGVLRGLQDTRTPLYVAIGINLANIVLNVTLVYGLGLGIRGA
ncbi:MATE family efflux transporter, partial [Desertihabitans aurantiacus]|uniref:MATE family efflux transporter n=1 Tax=Desertihabitans aurantiacus TaxID=2282477 RepID=UPI0022B7F266